MMMMIRYFISIMEATTFANTFSSETVLFMSILIFSFCVVGAYFGYVFMAFLCLLAVKLLNMAMIIMHILIVRDPWITYVNEIRRADLYRVNTLNLD